MWPRLGTRTTMRYTPLMQPTRLPTDSPSSKSTRWPGVRRWIVAFDPPHPVVSAVSAMTTTTVRVTLQFIYPLYAAATVGVTSARVRGHSGTLAQASNSSEGERTVGSDGGSGAPPY